MSLEERLELVLRRWFEEFYHDNYMTFENYIDLSEKLATAVNLHLDLKKIIQ